jgi:hypothetical protein
MIALFTITLFLGIFSTYYFIKIENVGSAVILWEVADFLMWDLHIIFPTIFALFLCSSATQKGKNLANHLEKHANFSESDSMSLKVELANL